LEFSAATTKQMELLQSIIDFMSGAQYLEAEQSSPDHLKIRQRIDGHTIHIRAARLQDVLQREDSDGRTFVQVNFQDGLKILITERLIGFKPVARAGAPQAIASPSGSSSASSSSVSTSPASKLPRVVTTPDLVSVLEAMEDAADSADSDLGVLRELFDSILRGAERAGFDVKKEKAWLLPYLNACPGLRANA
jgi:hypothetical protein